MKLLRAALALLLSYCLGVQPAVAQAQSAHVFAPVGVSAVGVSAAAGSAAVRPLTLQSLSILPTSALGLSAASFQSAPAASVLAATAFAAPVFASPASPKTVSPAQFAHERVAPIEAAAAKAVEGLERAGGDASRTQAAVQFSALTGEGLRARSDGVETPAPDAKPLAETGASSGLSKSAPPAPEDPKAEPPAPKSGAIVFANPQINKAFWLYTAAYSVFLFGFEMYVVGMPYLIGAITRNSLTEHHDARAASKEAVDALIRSNRSTVGIAHWVGQGLSYAATPLFMRNAETDGPGKWLVRSNRLRAGALALIVGLFFMTGFLHPVATIPLLVLLVATQSFFQGISVTTDGATTTLIMGAPGVTDEERTKANSILTVISAVMAIIGPVVAGLLALMKPVMGKSGVGGAAIYAIYSGAIAVASFIYASIKLIGPKNGTAKEGLTPTPTANAPNGLRGTLKELWISIRDGVRIVWKDPLLKVMLILSMVSSLFSYPLVFNVLPEYIEGIFAGSPALGAILNIPGLGWLLKTLTASPMGNFAVMMVMTALGSMAAAALIKPLTRLLKRFGFKTEEARTVPFFFIAALEAPLFFLMIGTHTLLGVVVLYGLQSLVTGFIGISIAGLYQKNLGGKGKDVNKILAAESLLGIAAAIVSLCLYKYSPLKDIAIGTALTIAAVATGVMALLRLFAPFMAFSKDQRHPPSPPPPDQPSNPVSTKPTMGDHSGTNFVNTLNL